MAALVLMFAAVGAKVVATQLIAKLNSRINHVEQGQAGGTRAAQGAPESEGGPGAEPACPGN